MTHRQNISLLFRFLIGCRRDTCTKKISLEYCTFFVPKTIEYTNFDVYKTKKQFITIVILFK